VAASSSGNGLSHPGLDGAEGMFDRLAALDCGAFLLLLDLLRDCVSRSSGLSMLAIMPVATRV
jgi:hypothetical protein